MAGRFHRKFEIGEEVVFTPLGRRRWRGARIDLSTPMSIIRYDKGCHDPYVLRPPDAHGSIFCSPRELQKYVAPESGSAADPE